MEEVVKIFEIFLQIIGMTVVILSIWYNYKYGAVFRKPIVKYGLPILVLLLIFPLYFQEAR
jgi:hypothetical protein